MRRVQSAPNLHNLTSPGISLKSRIQNAKLKNASTSAIPALLVYERESAAPFLQEPIALEVVQSISTERGLASGVCFEMYSAPHMKDEAIEDMAGCLSTPLSDDKGLGEIVQAELDDLLTRLREANTSRRKRLLENWVSKNRSIAKST